MTQAPVIYRTGEMLQMFGVTKSTLWRWVRETEGFPQPIKLSERVTAWKAEEVHDWINSRPAA